MGAAHAAHPLVRRPVLVRQLPQAVHCAVRAARGPGLHPVPARARGAEPARRPARGPGRRARGEDRVSQLDIWGPATRLAAGTASPETARSVTARFATGVVVITMGTGNRARGMTVSAFSVVARTPPLV